MKDKTFRIWTIEGFIEGLFMVLSSSEFFLSIENI